MSGLMSGLNALGVIFCRLLLDISGVLFKTIEAAYRLFYLLATTRLFGDDIIKQVTNNLYILVSVVILFAFAVKLIAAIVNPDLLTDTKKGVTGVLTRTIIGLLLIVAIPNIFNFLYYVQAEVITSQLIEKLVLGYTDEETTLGDTAGVINSTIITGFIYPVDSEGKPITEATECPDNKCIYAERLQEISAEANNRYDRYITLLGSKPDYNQLGWLPIDARWKNDAPMYSVNYLIIIAAGFVLYQLIILVFDTALRLVNLGILEIIFPVIIVSYIAGGNDYLAKWAKMTLQKFLSVFIRIAALSFMALGLGMMTSSNSVFGSNSVSFGFKLLVIIGLLRLVKTLPDIFSKIFGVDIKTGASGIKGRLGEMAGIGGLAQKAWTGVGKAAVGTATVVGAGAILTNPVTGAAVGTVVGTPVAAKILDKKFENKYGMSVGKIGRKIAQSKVGRGIQVAAAGIKDGKLNIKGAREALNTKFGPEIAAAKEREKIEAGHYKAERLKKASGGIIETKSVEEGSKFKKVDNEETIKNAKVSARVNLALDAAKVNARDVSDDNMKLFNKFKDDLLQEADMNTVLNHKKRQAEFIEKKVSSANGEQKSLIQDIATSISSGAGSTDKEIKSIMDKFDSIENKGSGGIKGEEFANAREVIRRSVLENKRMNEREEFKPYMDQSIRDLETNTTNIKDKRTGSETKLDNAIEAAETSGRIDEAEQLKELKEQAELWVNGVEQYQTSNLRNFATGRDDSFYVPNKDNAADDPDEIGISPEFYGYTSNKAQNPVGEKPEEESSLSNSSESNSGSTSNGGPISSGGSSSSKDSAQSEKKQSTDDSTVEGNIPLSGTVSLDNATINRLNEGITKALEGQTTVLKRMGESMAPEDKDNNIKANIEDIVTNTGNSSASLKNIENNINKASTDSENKDKNDEKPGDNGNPTNPFKPGKE